MDYDLSEDELPNGGGGFAGGSGPTFEDLAIDDSLSDLDRVAKYSCSSIALQRVIHVKMLADAARSVGFQQTCDILIPLLEPLVCDVEYVVRQHVALQFPSLCEFLVQPVTDTSSNTTTLEEEPSITSNATAGYKIMVDKLIPLLAKLVSDPQLEVRTAASESLVEVAALVKQEDQGQHILTIVLPLAHDDDNEKFRIAAISLYYGLAAHLGPELCQQFCVPELISLSEDPVFRVRKSTAQSFASVCKTAGHQVSRERLLPSFQKLAHDDIWAVRKACVESLVSISHALAPQDRGELLLPLYDSFLNDSSRWVRLAAYQCIGPFLASLERQDITDELLDHFLGMATSASAQLGGSGELDMRYHCAFSFPALLSIFITTSSNSKIQWPKFAPAFHILSSDTFWKVRRTLAFSLHEIAKLLGPELTESVLAPPFESYLKDPLPEIKYGALLHFADFLQHVSPQFRQGYLILLQELVDGLLADQSKWRTREILSLQLPQLCTLFSEKATFEVIYPLAIKLITDDVAVVRHQSAHACPLLIQRICGNKEWLEDAMDKLSKLAESPCFTDRQVFVLVCQSFLVTAEASSTQETQETKETEEEDSEKTSSLFETRLAPAFFALAKDRVSNVRVVFAEMLLRHREKLVSMASCPDSLRLLTAVGDDGSEPTVEWLMDKLREQLPPPVVAASAVAVAAVATTSVEKEEEDGEEDKETDASLVVPPPVVVGADEGECESIPAVDASSIQIQVDPLAEQVQQHESE